MSLKNVFTAIGVLNRSRESWNSLVNYKFIFYLASFSASSACLLKLLNSTATRATCEIGSTEVRRLLPLRNEVDSLSHLFSIFSTGLGFDVEEKNVERQIVEITSLCFLHERSRRVEEVEEGDSRCD